MLTRIRNAYAAKKTEVLVPYSKLKHNLAKVLMQESWIKDMEVKSEGTLKDLLLQLRYENGEPVISGIKRVSRPGQRIYTKNDSIPSVRGGMGTTIISTSRGLMPDRMARKEKVGGEIICQIW